MSIIIPLYKNLEFLRFQLAAFAIDPTINGAGGAEIILVLDSPEQRAELQHYLHGLFGLYAMPLTLVVHAANHGYSSANNSGAAVARARHLLFLNSDVIPDRSGWLPLLTAELEASPKTGAVGPKLLFEDDSLQHAGLFFGRDYRGRWINQHYHKGMPRDFAPACQPRAVPGVTGACLLMPSAVFKEIGGFTSRLHHRRLRGLGPLPEDPGDRPRDPLRPRRRTLPSGAPVDQPARRLHPWRGLRIQRMAPCRPLVRPDGRPDEPRLAGQCARPPHHKAP